MSSRAWEKIPGLGAWSCWHRMSHLFGGSVGQGTVQIGCHAASFCLGHIKIPDALHFSHDRWQPVCGALQTPLAATFLPLRSLTVGSCSWWLSHPALIASIVASFPHLSCSWLEKFAVPLKRNVELGHQRPWSKSLYLALAFGPSLGNSLLLAFHGWKKTVAKSYLILISDCPYRVDPAWSLFGLSSWPRSEHTGLGNQSDWWGLFITLWALRGSYDWILKLPLLPWWRFQRDTKWDSDSAFAIGSYRLGPFLPLCWAYSVLVVAAIGYASVLAVRRRSCSHRSWSEEKSWLAPIFLSLSLLAPSPIACQKSEYLVRSKSCEKVEKRALQTWRYLIW